MGKIFWINQKLENVETLSQCMKNLFCSVKGSSGDFVLGNWASGLNYNVKGLPHCPAKLPDDGLYLYLPVAFCQCSIILPTKIGLAPPLFFKIKQPNVMFHSV